MNNQDIAENLLSDFIDIRSPGKLFDVVESLQSFVQKGLLRQKLGTVPLNAIQRGTPFPDDIISIEFETIPGRTTYYLSCETYHGMGGAFWKEGHSLDGK
jgi:hypothetical protein